MMCFLDKPTSFGPSPICPRHLLARMILSRSLRSAIHLPTMVSVLPRISGVAPSGYTSAVSKKNTPASNALSMIANDASSSHWLPKVMVPRQISLTFKPVRPRRLIFMLDVLESLRVVGLEPIERALPAVFSRLFVEAGTVVGKERVARVGVDVNARSLRGGVRGRGQGLRLLLDRLDRDPLIFPAVKAQYRSLQLAYDVGRETR